jgi:hypothetical protein
MGANFSRDGRQHGLVFVLLTWVGAVAVGTLLQASPMGLAQQAKAQMPLPRPASAQAPAESAAGAAATPESPQAEWKKQSAQLLLLATQLKYEVDKTTENILSVKVIQKAREIEQFTHATEQQLKARN